MARTDEKTRTAFWLEKELLKRCDVCWRSNDFASRNEFVSRAIAAYIADVTLRNTDEVFTGRLAAAIAKATDDGMVKISKGLFRYAVEEEMILHLLARACGVTAEEVGKLRGMAIRNVRGTRGKISLEAIADFQNGRASEEDDR